MNGKKYNEKCFKVRKKQKNKPILLLAPMPVETDNILFLYETLRYSQLNILSVQNMI